MIVTNNRKIAAKSLKSGSAETATNRSYKAPAIRKDTKLAKVTGAEIKISGPT